MRVPWQPNHFHAHRHRASPPAAAPRTASDYQMGGSFLLARKNSTTAPIPTTPTAAAPTSVVLGMLGVLAPFTPLDDDAASAGAEEGRSAAGATAVATAAPCGCSAACQATDAAAARPVAATAAGSPSCAAAACTRLIRALRCTLRLTWLRRAGHAGDGQPHSCSIRSTLAQTASSIGGGPGCCWLGRRHRVTWDKERDVLSH